MRPECTCGNAPCTCAADAHIRGFFPFRAGYPPDYASCPRHGDYVGECEGCKRDRERQAIADCVIL